MADSLRIAAERIIASMKRNFSGGDHGAVPATPSEFRHLDLKAYEVFASTMAAQGFRHVADYAKPGLTNTPTTLMAHTMIRTMLSPDGNVAATYYQVKPRIGRRLKLLARGLLNLRLVAAPRNFVQAMETRHSVDIETALDDGMFFCTSNAEGAAAISTPPFIKSKFHPRSTTPAVLLDDHRRSVEEYLRANGGVRPLRMESVEDVMQMERRQAELKSSYRKSVEWITKEELERLGSSAAVSQAVFDEVRKILAEERAGAEKA